MVNRDAVAELGVGPLLLRLCADQDTPEDVVDVANDLLEMLRIDNEGRGKSRKKEEEDEREKREKEEETKKEEGEKVILARPRDIQVRLFWVFFFFGKKF